MTKSPIVRRIPKTAAPEFEQTAETGFAAIKFKKGLRNPQELVVNTMAELRRFLRVRDFKGLVACQVRLPGRSASQPAEIVVKPARTELVASNGALIAVAHQFFG